MIQVRTPTGWKRIATEAAFTALTAAFGFVIPAILRMMSGETVCAGAHYYRMEGV